MFIQHSKPIANVTKRDYRKIRLLLFLERFVKLNRLTVDGVKGLSAVNAIGWCNNIFSLFFFLE